MRSDLLRNDVIVTGNGNCKFEFVKAIARPGRTWMIWKLGEAVPVRTRDKLHSFYLSYAPVSSSCLQLGMLSGCCFHTLDRSRSTVS